MKTLNVAPIVANPKARPSLSGFCSRCTQLLQSGRGNRASRQTCFQHQNVGSLRICVTTKFLLQLSQLTKRTSKPVRPFGFAIARQLFLYQKSVNDIGPPHFHRHLEFSLTNQQCAQLIARLHAHVSRRIETIPSVERHDLRHRPTRVRPLNEAAELWRARAKLRAAPIPPVPAEPARREAERQAEAVS